MIYLKKILVILLLIFANSCKSTYDTKAFTNIDVPNAPNYNNLNSLDYYLGNSKNDADLRLNEFLINNLNYKSFE